MKDDMSKLKVLEEVEVISFLKDTGNWKRLLEYNGHEDFWILGEYHIPGEDYRTWEFQFHQTSKIITCSKTDNWWIAKDRFELWAFINQQRDLVERLSKLIGL